MKFLRWFLMCLVSLGLVFFILITSIRLMLTPLTPEIQYRLPNFPLDPYGFTFQDRLVWSKISIRFLTDNLPLTFLQDQKLANGDPLYNDRELSHMLDVQDLIRYAMIAWIILGIFLLIVRYMFWRWKRLSDYFRALSTGGWLAVGFIVAILAGVLIDFDGLFTAFHRIFFAGDTWLFYYSDSLIRLFPMEFWSNAFIAVGVLTIIVGLLFGILGNHNQLTATRIKMSG
jgi:integral membrane protein (TIGR01906 family)